MATMASTLSKTLVDDWAATGRGAMAARGLGAEAGCAATFIPPPPLGGEGGAGAFAAGAAAGAAAAAGADLAAAGPPAGMAGSLMVGEAVGLGGSEIRTVSFLGATFGASDGRGGTLDSSAIVLSEPR